MRIILSRGLDVLSLSNCTDFVENGHLESDFSLLH